MSAASLERHIPAGDRLLLDTSTLIAYLNGGELASPVADYVLDVLVKSGRNVGLVSMVSVTEILVRPLRRGTGARTVLDFLTSFPHLRLVNIDLFIAQHAAMLRAQHNVRTPDALTVATGLATGVGHLVTNDRRWEAMSKLLAPGIATRNLEDYLPFP